MADSKTLQFVVEVRNISALQQLESQVKRLQAALKAEAPKILSSEDNFARFDNIARKINLLVAAMQKISKASENEAKASIASIDAIKRQARAYQEAQNALENLSRLSLRFAEETRRGRGPFGASEDSHRREIELLSKKAQQIVATAQKYGVASSAVEKFGASVARAISGLEAKLLTPKEFVFALEKSISALRETVVKNVSRVTTEIDTLADKQRRASEIIAASHRKISADVISSANAHYIAERAVKALSSTLDRAKTSAPLLAPLLEQARVTIENAKAHGVGEQAIARFAVRLQRLNRLYREGVIDVNRYVAGVRAMASQLNQALTAELSRVDVKQPEFLGSFFRGITGFFVKLGVGVFVISRIIAGLRMLSTVTNEVVNAYADLIEAQNLLNVAFGNTSSSIKKWIDDTANTMFINAGRLMQTVSKWKLILEDIGLSSELATWLSKVFQKLALDVASLRNADVEKVTEAMISGLQGNIRPLRALGIDVSNATLEFYALASGIKTSSGELSTFERVMGVAMSVIASTAKDRGDFIATLGTTKNQLRILNDQWLYFKQRLGEVVVEGLNAAGTINNVSISLRGAHGLLTGLAPLLGIIGTSLRYIGDALANVFLGITHLAHTIVTPITELLTAIANTVTGVESLKNAFRGFWNETKENISTFSSVAGKLYGRRGSVILSALGEWMTERQLGRGEKAAAGKALEAIDYADRLVDSLKNVGNMDERIRAIIQTYGGEFSELTKGTTDLEAAFLKALQAADEFAQKTSAKGILPKTFSTIAEIPSEAIAQGIATLQMMMRTWSSYKDKMKTLQEEITATDEKAYNERIAIYKKQIAESEKIANEMTGIFREQALRNAKKAQSEIIAINRSIANEQLESARRQFSAIVKLIESGVASSDAFSKAKQIVSQIDKLYLATGASQHEAAVAAMEFNSQLDAAISKAQDFSKAFDGLADAVEAVIKQFERGVISEDAATDALQAFLNEANKLRSVVGDIGKYDDVVTKITGFFDSRLGFSQFRELKNILEAMDETNKSLSENDKERILIIKELHSEIMRITKGLEEQITNEEKIAELKRIQKEATEKLASAQAKIITLEERMTIGQALTNIGESFSRVFTQQLSSSLVDAFGGGNVYKALIRSFKSLGVALGKSMAGGIMEFIFGYEKKIGDKTVRQSGLIRGVFGFEDFWNKLSQVKSGPMGLSGAQIEGLLSLGTLLQAYGMSRGNRGMSAFGGAMTGFSAYLGYAAVTGSFNPIVAIVSAILMAIVGWFAGNGKEQIKYSMGIVAGRAVVDEIYRMTKEEERAVQEQLQSRFDDIRNAFEGVLIKLRQKITNLIFTDIRFGTMQDKRETINFQNALQAILQSELPRQMVSQVWPIISGALQKFGVQSQTLLAWKERFDTGAFDKVMPQFIKFVDLLVSAYDAAQKFGRSLDVVIAELERGSFAAWSGDFSKGIQEVQTALESIEGASLETQLEVLGNSLGSLSQLYEQATQFLKGLLQLRKQIVDGISNFLRDFNMSITRKESWYQWKESVVSGFASILEWLTSPPSDVQPEDVQNKVSELLGYAKSIEEIINYIASSIERLDSLLQEFNEMIKDVSTTFDDFVSLENASEAFKFNKTITESMANIRRLREGLLSITDPAQYASALEEIKNNAREAINALKEFGRAIMNAEKRIKESIQAMLEDITLDEFDVNNDVVGRGTYIIDQMRKYREMIASASSPEEVQYLVEQILRYAGMLRNMGDKILLEYQGQQMTVDEWLKLFLPELQTESTNALQKFKEQWESSRQLLREQLEGLTNDIGTERTKLQAEMDALIDLIRTGLGTASQNATNIINGFIDSVGRAITQINSLTNSILLFLQTLQMIIGPTPEEGGERGMRRRLPRNPGEPTEPPEPPDRRYPLNALAEQADLAAGAISDATTAAVNFARVLNSINGSVQITLVVDPAIIVDVEGRSDLVRVIRRS